MNERSAKDMATAMLNHIIKSQPNFLEAKNFATGAELAAFTTEFIDSYAEWIVKKNRSLSTLPPSNNT